MWNVEFKGEQELSRGQWQKIALSCAFMRSQADILVLDEPTSAIYQDLRKISLKPSLLRSLRSYP